MSPAVQNLSVSSSPPRRTSPRLQDHSLHSKKPGKTYSGGEKQQNTEPNPVTRLLHAGVAVMRNRALAGAHSSALDPVCRHSSIEEHVSPLILSLSPSH